MDDQRANREGGGRLKRGVRSLLLAILVSAILFGTLGAVVGLDYALKAGPHIANKGGPPFTVLEWVRDQFFGGMIFGGFIGVIGWVVLVIFDQLKKLFPTT